MPTSFSRIRVGANQPTGLDVGSVSREQRRDGERSWEPAVAQGAQERVADPVNVKSASQTVIQESKQQIIESMVSTLPFVNSRRALRVLDGVIDFAGWALTHPAGRSSLAAQVREVQRDSDGVLSSLMGRLYDTTIASLSLSERSKYYGDLTRTDFVQGDSFGHLHRKRLGRTLANMKLLAPVVRRINDKAYMDRLVLEYDLEVENSRINSHHGENGVTGLAHKCLFLDANDRVAIDAKFKSIGDLKDEIVLAHRQVVVEARRWSSEEDLADVEHSRAVNEARMNRWKMTKQVDHWPQSDRFVDFEQALKRIPCKQHFYGFVLGKRGGQKMDLPHLKIAASEYSLMLSSVQPEWISVTVADFAGIQVSDDEDVKTRKLTREVWDVYLLNQQESVREYMAEWEVKTQTARAAIRADRDLTRTPKELYVLNLAHSPYASCLVRNPTIRLATMKLALRILLDTKEDLMEQRRLPGRKGMRMMPAAYEAALRSVTVLRALANFSSSTRVRRTIPTAVKDRMKSGVTAGQGSHTHELLEGEAQFLLSPNAIADIVLEQRNEGGVHEFLHGVLRTRLETAYLAFTPEYEAVERLVRETEQCSGGFPCRDYVDRVREIVLESGKYKLALASDFTQYLEEYPTAESMVLESADRTRVSAKLEKEGKMVLVEEFMERAIKKLSGGSSGEIPERTSEDHAAQGDSVVRGLVSDFTEFIMRGTTARFISSLGGRWKTGRSRVGPQTSVQVEVTSITKEGTHDESTKEQICNQPKRPRDLAAGAMVTCRPWTSPEQFEVVSASADGMLTIQAAVAPFTARIVYRADVRTEGEVSSLSAYRAERKILAANTAKETHKRNSDMRAPGINLKNERALEEAVMERLRLTLRDPSGLEFLNTWGSNSAIRTIRHKTLEKIKLLPEEEIIFNNFLQGNATYVAMLTTELTTSIDCFMLPLEDPAAIKLATMELAKLIREDEQLQRLLKNAQAFKYMGGDRECALNIEKWMEKVQEGAWGEGHAIGVLLRCVMDSDI